MASWLLNYLFSMSDVPTKSSRAPRNTGIGVAVALLFYVLSMAPAYRLTRSTPFLRSAYRSAYSPLQWLYQHDHIVTRSFLNWYFMNFDELFPDEGDRAFADPFF